MLPLEDIRQAYQLIVNTADTSPSKLSQVQSQLVCEP